MIRYTPRRKAEIVAAALKEPSKVEELLKEHGISPEELSTWCDSLSGAHVIIDVGGVGYVVMCSARSLRDMGVVQG